MKAAYHGIRETGRNQEGGSKYVIRARSIGLTLALLLLTAALVGCSAVLAATYHVAPNGSSSGDGSEANPWDLPTANANLQPGDTAILHGGNYSDPISPAHSGTAGSPITYQAASGETPVIQGMNEPIYIPDKSYLVFDGISVDNVYWWVEANDGASHLTFTNCTFTNADAYEASWFMGGTDIHITNCSFSGGEDSIHMMAVDHALIENNTFNGATHECIFLGGVQDSVVRNNYFSNPDQKCMEVAGTYDNEWSGPFRKSERIVIEDNEFALGAGSDQSFAGIQWVGNNSIVRRNVFHDCGFGVDLSTWDDPDAQYDEHNRFYNNTFYKNGYLPEGVGIFFSDYDANAAYGDNIFKNNIIYLNKATLTDGGDMTESVQVAFNWNPTPADAGFYYNLLFYTAAGQKLFSSLNLGKEYTLAEYEAAFPSNASDNIEANPKMVDPDNGDFTLQSDSPCIDAGGPLTHTTSAGSGTTIPVADALYFSDGKGLVDPDVIRVGGQQATIVSVDYDNNEITVSSSLSWANNDPVTLDYDGSAPDIGAHEYAGGPPPPQPPVADFVGNPTSGTVPLTVNFTDQSTNSPTSWSWDFGDTGRSTAQNPSHEYTSTGSYTVSLTATNAQGSDTETKPDYITVSEQPQTSCHVGSIDLVGYHKTTGKPSGRGYYAEATITVHDQDCNVLAGVTVDITWSGCVSGTDSGVTDSNGQVVFTSPVNADGGTFTCTVDNLTKSGYPYDSASNHETSDSIQNP